MADIPNSSSPKTDTNINQLLMNIQYRRLNGIDKLTENDTSYPDIKPQPAPPEPSPSPSPEPEPTEKGYIVPNIYYVPLNRYPYAYDLNNVPQVLLEEKDITLKLHDVVVVPWCRTNIEGVCARVCEDIAEAYEYMYYEPEDEEAEPIVEWTLIWSDRIRHPVWDITLVPDPEEEEPPL